LQIGRRVRIDHGPLSGLEGILLEIRGQHRLVLSVTLLQRSVAVQVDSAWATPLPQPWARTEQTSGRLLQH
jgi:transcription antitermination factor NusG